MQHEVAFREELEGSCTLEDVTTVIAERRDLGELVGVTAKMQRGCECVRAWVCVWVGGGSPAC